MRLIPVRFLLLGDLLARFARAPWAGLEPRTNGALQVMHTFAQRSDGRYNGQGPFPQAVKELPSVLALFLRLPLATRGSLTKFVHADSP
jgi:hypothetical protein